MANGKKVLLIGLEPKFVDYASLPVPLDAATLSKQLAADEKKLRDLGYDAGWLLIDRGETAEKVVTAKLQSETYDCILVGAGIRTIAPLFPLFEKLVNVIHEKAPRAKIAFNTEPDDTAKSVQRWV
jgi:hypothetical protein